STTAKAGAPASTPSPSSSSTALSPNHPPPNVTVDAAVPLVGDTSERSVVVETTEVVATFTNRGGRLKSWRLKHYQDQQRQPLELIATDVAPPVELPFSLTTADATLTATLNDALYSVKADVQNSTEKPADVTFEYRTAD